MVGKYHELRNCKVENWIVCVMWKCDVKVYMYRNNDDLNYKIM